MAIVTLASFTFFGATTTVFIDDVALRVTRVEVVNSGNETIYAEVRKLTNPKRTFSQTFSPGANVGYDLPAGFTFTILPNDSGGYSVPDIVCYARVE